MSVFQRLVTFVLGLFVVILVAVVVTNRFNVRDKIQSTIRGNNAQENELPTPTQTITAQNTSPSPSPTKTMIQPFVTATQNEVTNTNQNEQKGAPTAVRIPNTGSPTLLLPLAGAMFGMGILLRRIR